MVDAQNAVSAVRFKHAPAFEEALVSEAEKLAAERAKLEQALTALAEREEDVRAGWRTVASAIPGQDASLLEFGDGSTVPSRQPTEPHHGIVAFVAQDDWPSWFHDAIRAAASLYGARDGVIA